MIRYDDMRIDRLLIKDYQQQLEKDLKTIGGLNDIEGQLNHFEQTFAAYIGTRYSFAVNSGTDALQLALLTLGIGRGDSVLIPSVTYPAVALSVLYAGAEPILVDAREDLQIDDKQLEVKARKNTKAVIAAHMFARPCNIGSITALARRRGWKVIEDCCQSESSTLSDKKLGSFGDISCFSFSYYKPLSSCGGGGGMVCFNDPSYLSIVDYTKMWAGSEQLAQAGQRFSRMNLLDLIAVKVKWRYLKEIIRSRLQIKALYEEGMAGCQQIRLFTDSPGSVSVAQNFVIYSERRNALGDFLRKNGIVWQKPYAPLNGIKMFSRFAKGAYPQSRAYFNRAIHLPLFSFMKKEEAEKVVDCVKGFFCRDGK